MNPKMLLTVSEAAAALAISRSKLYELFAAGLVRSVRIDGSRRARSRRLKPISLVCSVRKRATMSRLVTVLSSVVGHGPT